MSDIPNELKYTATHEWVRMEEDGSAVIGITDHAQAMLGDIVYVNLPDFDQSLNKGSECGVIESVKAAADLYSPVSGQIVDFNEHLQDTPELINEDPYGEGWLFRVSMNDDQQLAELLDAAGYKAELSE